MLKAIVKRMTALLLALLLVAGTALPTVAETVGTGSVSDADTAPSLPEPPVLVSDAVVVMDAETGTVLYDKNADAVRYPASCTKILTAILALENGVLTDEVTMSHEAIFGIDRSSNHIALNVGEVVTVEQLLYALLIASANECAIGLAEYISAKLGGDGTVAHFASLMNARAAELGAKNSHFVNPNGLFEDDHTSTPYDLAMLMKHAITLPNFVKISGTTYYNVRTDRVPSGHPFTHTNKSLSGGKYYYTDVVCGKSGFTKQAGSSLVTYAERGDTKIIVVTMGNKNIDDTYTDTLSLLDHFLGSYTVVRPQASDKVTGELALTHEVTAPVYSDVPEKLTLPVGFTLSDLSYQLTADSDLTFPLKAGSKVGTVAWLCGDYVVANGTLYASFDVDEPAAPSLKEPSGSNLLSTVLLIIGIIFGGIAALIVLFLIAAFINRTFIRKRRRKKRQQQRLWR